MKLDCTVGNNKKDFQKYTNSKRRSIENIGPLLEENDHLTKRDGHKAETFNVSTSVKHLK